MELERRTISSVRMQEKGIQLGLRTERSTAATNNGQRQ